MKYSPEIEREIQSLVRAIEDNGMLAEKYSSRWLALQLLEGDTT
ncbi:MAG: iron transporter FeoB, partial [Anaerolineales bacterium]